MRTPVSCTVLIGPADRLPALTKLTKESGELLTFTDAEALRALEAIFSRKPQVVALERLFAATPRGAALINRIKADPQLEQSEIRIISHDGDYSRVSSRQKPPASMPAGDGIVTATLAPPAPQPLDHRGTRRAPRFRLSGSFGALLDGNAATVIDLSTVGAQVVSSVVLKPNQVVRMAISDDHDHLRFNASVAWALYEISPSSGPRYRAGMKFIDADGGLVGGFCQRHKAS